MVKIGEEQDGLMHYELGVYLGTFNSEKIPFAAKSHLTVSIYNLSNLVGRPPENHQATSVNIHSFKLLPQMYVYSTTNSAFSKNLIILFLKLENLLSQ